MFCGNCGAEVKEGAKFCGSCGQPLIQEVDLDTGAPAGNEAGQRSFQQPEADPALGTAQPPVTPDPGAGYDTYIPEPPAPKKKKRYAIIGIIAVALAAAILLVAMNFKTVSNSVRRTFSSPEHYYQHVEREAMGEVIKSTMDVYENDLQSNLGSDQMANTVVTTLTIGDPTRELAESLTGMDMDWLQTIGVWEDMEVADGKTELNLSLDLNSTQIGQVNVVMDEDNLYFRLPELSEDYVRVPMNQMTPYVNYGMQRTATQMMGMAEVLPERDQLDSILDRYVNVIIDDIDDVEKGTGTLNADTVSQSYTTLTVRLNGETLEKIIEDLCDTALEDAELQELIKSVAESVGADPDDAWDDIRYELKDARSYADNIADQVDIEMTLYVDGQGEVRGRTIEINDYVELEYAAPEKGNQFGVRLAVSQDGYEQFEFEGSGKGSDGTFALAVEGVNILEVTASGMNRDAMKEGYLNGTFDITLSSAAANQLEDEMSYMVGGRMLDLRDAHLILESSANRDTSQAVLRLVLEDEEYLSVSAEKSPGSRNGVTVPNDSTAVERWAERLDTNKLRVYVDNLEEAGVPRTLLNMLFYGMY